MTEVNFQKLIAKFGEHPARDEFQYLSYLVFCHKYGRNYGIFAYENHPGIETATIVDGSDHVGFQAKFYLKDLDSHEGEFVDSIKTAKLRNAELTVFMLFLPVDPWPNQNGVGNVKPLWMSRVEKAGQALGVRVDWFGLTQFKRIFAEEKLEHWARHFFSSENGAYEFVAMLCEKTERGLADIRSSININGETLKLPRQSVSDLLNKSSNSSCVVLYGEGGVGKTAVIKDLYDGASFKHAILVLKPYEVSSLFRIEALHANWGVDFSVFFDLYADVGSRTLVVDAAEKLNEMSELDDFVAAIRGFIEHAWKIVFTTRTIYHRQLLEVLKFRLNISGVEVQEIKGVANDKLAALAERYGFELPNDVRVRALLGNPFNLNCYLSLSCGRDGLTVSDFRNRIWLHFILGDNPSDAAGDAFLAMVDRKISLDATALKPAGQERVSTGRLIDRGVLARMSDGETFAVKHDIYEEWAQQKIIEKTVRELDEGPLAMFLESSRGRRKAYRLWASAVLANEDPDFMEKVWQYWRCDIETLRTDTGLAVTSPRALGHFLLRFEDRLLQEPKEMQNLLENVFYLCRKERRGVLGQTVQVLDEDIAGQMIRFICAHREEMSQVDETVVLRLLRDWSLNHPADPVTELCADYAFAVIDASDGDRRWGRDADALAELLAASCWVRKEDVEKLVNEYIEQPHRDKRFIVDRLCVNVLKNPYETWNICFVEAFPSLVLKMAKWAWVRRLDGDDGYSLDNLERYCGLTTDYDFKYFPASALQTPLRKLLFLNPSETKRFVLDFINGVVESALKTGFYHLDKTVIELPNGRTVEQVYSPSLWSAHRGTIGENWPDLFKSVHMVLESWLLDLAKSLDEKDDVLLDACLLELIEHSKSASVTGVVASVVLSYPWKCRQTALAILSSLPLVQCDLMRQQFEGTAETLYCMGLCNTVYDIERQKTLKDAFRKSSLENVYWAYQQFECEQDKALASRTQAIIARHREKWTDLPEALRFLIARIDRSHQTAHEFVDEKTHQKMIRFDPELTEDMRQAQKSTQKAFEPHALAMRIECWAQRKLGLMRDDAVDPYEEDVRKVLQDFYALMRLRFRQTDEMRFLYVTARRYAAAALLIHYRDHLSCRDLLLIRRVVVGGLNYVLSEKYGPQVGDGVNAVMMAAPGLLRSWITSWGSVRRKFILCLLEEMSVGNTSDRVCDWGFAGVRSCAQGAPGFCEAVLRDYRTFFSAYCGFNPDLDCNNKKGSIFKRLQSRLVSLVDKFGQKFARPDEAMFGPSWYGIYHRKLPGFAKRFMWSKPIERPMAELERGRFACNMIRLLPGDKNLDQTEVDFLIGNIPLALRYIYQKKDRGGLCYHSVSTGYTKILAQFMLRMSPEDQARAIKAIGSVREVFSNSNLLEGLILAQGNNKDAESFWRIWKGFLPVIAEYVRRPCSRSLYGVSELLDTYLLGWRNWNTTLKKWDALDETRQDFYEDFLNLCDDQASVALSFVRLIATVGEVFVVPAMGWIDRILAKNKHKMYGENLKRFVAEFEGIFPLIEKHGAEIRENVDVRRQLERILDFLIMHHSLESYRFRELFS